MIGCTFVLLNEDGHEPEIRLAMLEVVPTEGATLSFASENSMDPETYVVQHVHFSVTGALTLRDESPEALVEFPLAAIEAQITLVPDHSLIGDSDL